MRILLTLAAAAVAFTSPAQAQFFFQPPDLTGAPVRGDEPDVTTPLPDATEAELTASLVWHLRAALNVAALQCDFEPILLTRRNYNALLLDHKDELKNSYDTLGRYFARTTKTKKAAQNALDQFGTRTYSSFSAVSAQYTFCETAGMVGRRALFAPRGLLGVVAKERLREVRNSTNRAGEQRFPRLTAPRYPILPSWEKKCWNGKGEYNVRKCGYAPLAA